MHLVIPVTIATAMAADVMRQRCFSVYGEARGDRLPFDATSSSSSLFLVLYNTSDINIIIAYIHYVHRTYNTER